MLWPTCYSMHQVVVVSRQSIIGAVQCSKDPIAASPVYAPFCLQAFQTSSKVIPKYSLWPYRGLTSSLWHSHMTIVDIRRLTGASGGVVMSQCQCSSAASPINICAFPQAFTSVDAIAGSCQQHDDAEQCKLKVALYGRTSKFCWNCRCLKRCIALIMPQKFVHNSRASLWWCSKLNVCRVVNIDCHWKHGRDAKLWSGVSVLKLALRLL